MTTIVVVDDRIVNRNILTRLAASIEEGVDVLAFEHPQRALTALAERAPDLVITDFTMPDMDGAAFIAALRRMAHCADIPIVVVTVYEDREYCYRALEAGATDYLLSPVDHHEFRVRARNLLLMRRQQIQLSERAAQLDRTLATATAEHESFRQASQERLTNILDAVPTLISAIDRQGRYSLLNQSMREFYRLSPTSAAPHRVDVLRDEEERVRADLLDAKVFESAEAVPPFEHTVAGADGQARVFLTNKSPLIGADGQVSDVITVSLDVTDMRAAERRMHYEARHDRTTGLANREALRDRMAREVERVNHFGGGLALLLLDLDRFKTINDMHGHQTGDNLLRLVAARMQRMLRDDDLLTRIGGDEFAVLQTGVYRPEQAAELARRLATIFYEPFSLDGHEVHISTSIGLAMMPQDAAEPAQLFKCAELAMYRAKTSGRNHYRFYDAEMNIAVRKQVTLERELRHALDAEELTCHYQPQVDLPSGRIIGMEALVRWRHPQRGLVAPGEFIGLAEDVGLIAPLTMWVLHLSCRQLRRWQEDGFTGLKLSVNLSPTHLRERGLEQMVEAILQETGVAPDMLDLELTESTVMDGGDSALRSLRHLNQLGVSFSIDDFGTGYSSLTRVRRLPVDRLKIDRSFVANLERSPNDAAIVRAIVNLGRSLSLHVVAEGVEKPEQLAFLRAVGCDAVQGNLFSPAVPAEEFTALLRAGGMFSGSHARNFA